MTVSDDWSEFSPPEEIREPHECWPSFDLDFTVETDDAGREQCTIYPESASEEEIVTTWMTAGENAFVNVSEIR